LPFANIKDALKFALQMNRREGEEDSNNNKGRERCGKKQRSAKVRCLTGYTAGGIKHCSIEVISTPISYHIEGYGDEVEELCQMVNEYIKQTHQDDEAPLKSNNQRNQIEQKERC
jgi:hypothetical protein